MSCIEIDRAWWPENDLFHAKLGSNLPSYGWLLPATIHSMKGGETWHHIRIHSMKGGVRLWCETWHQITIHSMKGGVRTVVWALTSHNNTLNEGWCETVVWNLTSHNSTLNVGGVRRWRETWHHITIHSCNAGLATSRCKMHCDGCMNVAWGFVTGRKPEHETLCFSVQWLQAAMKGTSCVGRLRFGSFRVSRSIGSASVFWNEWTQIAL